MFNDIFSKKAKKIEEIKKLEIIVDIHEKNSLVLSSLHELGSKINLMSLKVGDYLIGNTIIERKTFADFISSMLNKRLIQQLKNLQQYEKRVLILEGKDFERLENTNMNPNAIRGMILSISLEYNTPIIYTKDSEETAKFLYLLAKRQILKPQKISFHVKKPISKEEQKQYLIESFPDIGPKTAEKLLKEFKTIRAIINASNNELERVIGKKAVSFKIVDE